MATGKTTGNAEFLEFLKGAPTLEEATSQDATELTGIVSRTEGGKFAITTSEGQTYELETAAVLRFRALEGPGFAKVATIQVSNEALKTATLRPIKPLFKELIKDPIKDIIGDGKRPPIDTLAVKDIRTDPIADKPGITDPIVDQTSFFKDIHKDPLQDPVKPPVLDPVGTGPADVLQPDPIDQVVNPAAAAAAGGPMPFAMATPHHAPQHLLEMQMGAPAPGVGGPQAYKPLPWEKHPWTDKAPWIDKVPWADTRKEIVKEPIRDTVKELISDPKRPWEGTWDPGQLPRGPFPEPWAGGFGFM